MKMKWTEKAYGWFRDSSEYTGYDARLARIIREKAKGCRSMCDMGCGAAALDMEMSCFMDSITCVDIDPVVIECIRSDVVQRGISNIKAVCGNGSDTKGHWDLVTAVFHARNMETVMKYLSMASKYLVVVVRESRMTETGLDEYRRLDCFDSETMKRSLSEQGISYDFSSLVMEHGQPFRNYEDAVDYVMLYCGMTDPSKARAFLDVRLTKTADVKFPYYLPKEKHFGLFVISK